MNTESKARRRGRWLLPVVLALPFLAAILLAAVRFGPDLLRLINVAIKAVVVS